MMDLKEMLYKINTSYDENVGLIVVNNFYRLPVTDQKVLLTKIHNLNPTALKDVLKTRSIVRLLSLSEINNLLEIVYFNLLPDILFDSNFYLEVINKCNKLNNPIVASTLLIDIYQKKEYIDSLLKMEQGYRNLDQDIIIYLISEYGFIDIFNLLLKDINNINHDLIIKMLIGIINNNDNIEIEKILPKLPMLTNNEVTVILSNIVKPEVINTLLNYYKINSNELNYKCVLKLLLNDEFIKRLSTKDLINFLKKLDPIEVVDYISNPHIMRIIGSDSINAILEILPKDEYNDYLEVIADNEPFDETLFMNILEKVSLDDQKIILGYPKVTLKLSINNLIKLSNRLSSNDLSFIEVILNSMNECFSKQIFFLNGLKNSTIANKIYKKLLLAHGIKDNIDLNDLNQKLETDLEKKLLSGKDSYEYEYLIDYLGNKTTNINKILSYLWSNDHNYDHISKTYYQIILKRMLNALIKKNVKINTRVSYTNLKDGIDGSFEELNTQLYSIKINLNMVKDNLEGNVPLIEMMFREIFRIIKHSGINNGIVEYDDLVTAKEEIINYVNNNYSLDEIHENSETRNLNEKVRSYTYQFINKFDEADARRYYDNASSKIDTPKENKNNDEVFDEILANHCLDYPFINYIFSKYPILALEYDSQSLRKKSIGEIIMGITENYNSFKDNMDNEASELYRFYLDLFSSRINQIDNSTNEIMDRERDILTGTIIDDETYNYYKNIYLEEIRNHYCRSFK